MCEHTFVRWDNLTIEAQEGTALPGYREPAVVRHFDAPEALDTRFYEVRAKSALNRVPERSRMPFRWTINPYRGCAHACKFCMQGDTPILMANGGTKPLADLVEGDEIYGTVRRGSYRRYVTTQVRALWPTRKHVYRIRLEDGTELFASGDHRFLSDRGWKYVAGSERGHWRRPHLTLNNKLIGTGAFAEPPIESEAYRRGYLCGMIRGDGHVACRQTARRAGHAEVRNVRLALVDFEALARARDYLALASVQTREYLFRAAAPGYKPVNAISTCLRDGASRIADLITWPRTPTEAWCKGFLAGIFDAEGSFGGGPGGGTIRIANTDSAIIEWTTYCLRRLGFAYVVEPTRNANGLQHVRVAGGLPAQLRFFHTCDPAITRKRTIEGTALKSTARLCVVSIDRMGIRDLYDITTGTGDFIANGVVSHNCFARPTHTYLGFDADRDFDREIVVKVNVPEVLRVELARASWKGEHVAMGTNTDPYQWVEGRYKLMRGIWEAFRDAANPCSVLTKSPLLLRDLDLMKEIAAVTDISANLSVPTIDEKAWRASEPHTPNPRARLEAVAELNRAGIPTGILVAPLMPGINDDPAQVQEILQAAADAGATGVSGIGLHLRGEVRGVFMDWLRSYRPDLVERYEELYARSAYLPRVEQERIGALVRRARTAARTTSVGAFRREPGRDYEAMRPWNPAMGRPPRAPEGEQTTLF
jgi:DNA repair photolyase